MRIAPLALADLKHDWRIALCLATALGAVMVPLLILFGLKFGLVEGLLQRLRDDPINTQIVPVGSGKYDVSWFDRMRDTAGMGFLMPSTRTIAATLWLESPSADGQELLVDLVPTGAGDPLVDVAPESIAPRDIWLSARVSEKLGLAAGMQVTAYVQRKTEAGEESEEILLNIKGLIPRTKFDRIAVLASLSLLEGTERYRDGYKVPEFGWAGNPLTSTSMTYASFRMYAKTIDDVESVERRLREQGVEVHTKAHEIALVHALDRSLTFVFWVLCGSATLGFGVSMSSNLVANVHRKRRDLGLLRLIGFESGEVIAFPVIQSLVMTAIGCVLAIAGYCILQSAVNRHFGEGSLSDQGLVCTLRDWHFLVAVVATMAVALIASIAAAMQTARIAPYEGLRNE